MTAASNLPQCCPTRSRGFTLIELLVVIVILGVLVSLLVPVIASAFRTANDASVAAEITLLDNALAAFKDKYGDYPPSRLIFSENGDYSALVGDTTPVAPGDLGLNTLATRSIQSLRKTFPRVRVKTTAAGTSSYIVDLNGNNTPDTYFLDGPECLVFFLGGMRSTSGVGVVGFAKSPLNPFALDNTSPNRDEPFFEFQTDRLVDLDNDGFYEYIDPLAPAGSDARPYAYFSTNGSFGYDPNDYNFGYPPTLPAETDPNTGSVVARYIRVTFPVPGRPDRALLSAAPNPYTASVPLPTNTNGDFLPCSFIKPSTYQIISAGSDRLYGFGGQWDNSSLSSKLPALTNELPSPPMAPNDPAIRVREADNITNFSAGTLN